MDRPPAAGSLWGMKRVVFVAFVAVFAFAGCPAEDDCNAIEPEYAGAATDETWRVMLDARSTAEETTDVEVVVPTDGEEIPQGNDPPSFAWESTLQVSMLELPHFSSPRARPKRGLFDDVAQLVFPVAHAHQPPITSDLYFLEIDVEGRACPVSALTTLESMIFSDTDWDEVTAAPGEKTLNILSAFVTENRITEGPFKAKPVTFSVVE